VFVVECLRTWDTIRPIYEENGWSTMTKDEKIEYVAYRWLRTKQVYTSRQKNKAAQTKGNGKDLLKRKMCSKNEK